MIEWYTITGFRYVAGKARNCRKEKLVMHILAVIYSYVFLFYFLCVENAI